ncbi:MAG TPA: hypothetical protein VMR73_01080 [Candidatus Paceibacterota bacterium]|nr:hypothetical protein [Candidatus Paceibacterota bacterium]
MNKFLEKDVTGNWNTVPPIPDDKIKNVNCHKFALYVIGKISWEEMISNPDAQKKMDSILLLARRLEVSRTLHLFL